jgi:hypothetical protein
MPSTLNRARIIFASGRNNLIYHAYQRVPEYYQASRFRFIHHSSCCGPFTQNKHHSWISFPLAIQPRAFAAACFYYISSSQRQPNLSIALTKMPFDLPTNIIRHHSSRRAPNTVSLRRNYSNTFARPCPARPMPARTDVSRNLVVYTGTPEYRCIIV